MEKSKAISVLKSLNPKEFRETGELIFSPLHNKNKNVRSLYTQLKKFYPDFSDSKLTKEYLYAKLFPGKSFSDKTMRNLLSDLLKLTEEYLAIRQFKNSRYVEQYFKVVSSAAKNLDNLTVNNLERMEEILAESNFDGGSLYYFMHLNEMEKDFFKIKRNKLIHLNMKEGEYLVYTFLVKFFAFKMKYFNYRYKLGKEKLSEFMLEFEHCFDSDRFMSYLEMYESEHKEQIRLYYFCMKFMEDTDREEFYFKAKDLLAQINSKMSRTEVLNIFLTFNAYCIAKIRQGNTLFNNELLSIYKEMLNTKMLIGENESHMHITIFNNIVGLGLSTGESEWTLAFIENYSSYLIPEFSDTMRNYAYAQYYFAISEFERSHDHINKVNFDNYYIKSGSRMLLLKIYYELDYTEPLLNMCDSIKHYLSHDTEIPDERKTEDIRLVNYISRLTKYRNTGDKKNLENLFQSVRHETAGANIKWLTEKIEAAMK